MIHDKKLFEICNKVYSISNQTEKIIEEYII